MGRSDAHRCRALLWQICRRTFVPAPPWGGNSTRGFAAKLGKVAPIKGIPNIRADKRTFFLTVPTKGKEATQGKDTDAIPATWKVGTTLKKYKIHITYYSVLVSLFCIFAYCVVKLLLMLLHEPACVKMVKERVLQDQALTEEYGNVTFSRFWGGYINEDHARIIINIWSDKKKNKKGKVIGNLINQKDGTWAIKTLTYYTVKRNDDLHTDDMKTLRPGAGQASACPVGHGCQAVERQRGERVAPSP
ncbi:conserved Plasmodium protein, unknown function [Plasmodium vivax]|uniref:Uncharacterized protein n=2 Tax=Plasmodium vivax TaxID=5855 RepID=A0A1G4H9Y6_PLAVI|nr:hypothetical protein PVNG_01608 [Plasmodium vivax North Korean]SCO71616.1 conserved Plasmodium protein, unknown function [Plasmodium vivax]